MGTSRAIYTEVHKTSMHTPLLVITLQAYHEFIIDFQYFFCNRYNTIMGLFYYIMYWITFRLSIQRAKRLSKFLVVVYTELWCPKTSFKECVIMVAIETESLWRGSEVTYAYIAKKIRLSIRNETSEEKEREIMSKRNKESRIYSMNTHLLTVKSEMRVGKNENRLWLSGIRVPYMRIKLIIGHQRPHHYFEIAQRLNK